MNNLSLRRSFVLFHLTLGVVILVASVRTILAANSTIAQHPAGSHLYILAGVEAIAAMLFLIPKTLKIGSAVLLLIFGIAMMLHGAMHELDLIVFASGVLFVAVHGSAYSRELIRGQQGVD